MKAEGRVSDGIDCYRKTSAAYDGTVFRLLIRPVSRNLLRNDRDYNARSVRCEDDGSLPVNRVACEASSYSKSDLYARAIPQPRKWVSQGKIKYTKTVASAFENAQRIHRHACAPTSASNSSSDFGRRT
jgi:hypothetical protein